MVFAVQCPNPKCRKYMLVEDRDRENVVACLLCRTPIKAGGETAEAAGGTAGPPGPPPVRRPPKK